MTATQPEKSQTTASKIYRAKVTGRHAITLPAELCRELGIEVGDSVELTVTDGVATLRPLSVLPISALRGILKPYFPDSQSIRDFLDEERADADEREALLDQIWDRQWQSEKRSCD